MEQTAIQELIKEMEQLKQTKLYVGSFKAIEDCIALAYNKVEMEKQQIIDAYQTSHISMMTAEQYYNETFKQ